MWISGFFVGFLATTAIAFSAAAQDRVQRACLSAHALPVGFEALTINNRSEIGGGVLPGGSGPIQPALIRANNGLGYAPLVVPEVPPAAVGISGVISALNDNGDMLLNRSYFQNDGGPFFTDETFILLPGNWAMPVTRNHVGSGPTVSAIDGLRTPYGSIPVTVPNVNYPIQRAAVFETVDIGFVPTLIPVPYQRFNDAGRVVGVSELGDQLITTGYEQYSNTYLVRTGAPHQQLPAAPGTAAQGVAISGSGKFVTGRLEGVDNGVYESALWIRQGGSLVREQILPPRHGSPAPPYSRDVASNGDVVGVWEDGVRHQGFLYNYSLRRSFTLESQLCPGTQLSGYQIVAGNAINDRGEILATGLNAAGARRGFLLRQSERKLSLQNSSVIQAARFD
jgi:hypothetical protein